MGWSREWRRGGGEGGGRNCVGREARSSASKRSSMEGGRGGGWGPNDMLNETVPSFQQQRYHHRCQCFVLFLFFLFFLSCKDEMEGQSISRCKATGLVMAVIFYRIVRACVCVCTIGVCRCRGKCKP